MDLFYKGVLKEVTVLSLYADLAYLIKNDLYFTEFPPLVFYIYALRYLRSIGTSSFNTSRQ